MKAVMARIERIFVPAVVVMGLLAWGYPSPASGQQQEGDSPSLVVLLVVDQLGGELLERYRDVFTGGLRRLLDGGMHFTRATHDFAMTATAPGHTTLSTGVFPTRHGIVGNGWTEYDEQGESRSVYSMADSSSPILGDSTMEGRSSANIRRDGLANWIRGADARSRTVSLSKKDRSAIGMMATQKGDVFWFDSQAGRFVTSTYYFEAYPKWVQQFNDQVMPVIFADTIWESRVPASLVGRSRPDTAAFEGRDGHSSFPHVLRNEVSQPGLASANLWRANTPLPDLAVLRIAQAALRDRKLGQRGVTDFLAVSFSQADIVGHAYGPESREQLDNLLRLDERIGTLLDALDHYVGEGKWVLGFSADHGVLPIPEFRDPPGGRISAQRTTEIYDPVWALVSEGLRGAELQRRLIEILEKNDEIADAMAYTEIDGVQTPADSFAVLYSHSFSSDRVTSPLGRWGVEIRWIPNFLSNAGWARGTTHGSPYYYDRWVPMIFYGAGVEAGESEGAASSVDMAPTLAALAGISVPDDLDGKVLVGGR